MRTALVLTILVLTGAAGDLLLSKLMKRVGEVKLSSLGSLVQVGFRVVKDATFWLAILLMAISFFSLLALFSWAPVSFVVPATALGYIVGTIAARFILRERVNVTRWAGVIFVCVGVILASEGDIFGQASAQSFLLVLRWLVLVLAVVPFCYYIVSIYAARKFFSAQRHKKPFTTDFAPPVSILKPVRGLDREAYENFASFCRLDYPEYEVLFAVQEESDPAVLTIRKVIADFPDIQIRLLIGFEDLGPSAKVCKMARLVREARYDLFVFSDSDVRVDHDYLRMIVGPFRDPRVGVVTALYRGTVEGKLGSYLDCVGASVEFTAGTLVANFLGGIHFALGATMATTRERLEEIGGFELIADRHSDDFEFGNRIAQRGYRVELARKPVWMINNSQTFWEYLRHELRWTIGLRNVHPGGHAGLFFTQGFALTIAAFAVAPTRSVAFAYLIASGILRFATAWTVGVWGLEDPVVRRWFWLLPLRDFFAFPVWLASFLTKTIEWRGSRYTIHRGRLIPIDSPGAVD
jgi:ceramide glucosyltransferase